MACIIISFKQDSKVPKTIALQLEIKLCKIWDSLGEIRGNVSIPFVWRGGENLEILSL